MEFETGRFTHADPATVRDRETFINSRTHCSETSASAEASPSGNRTLGDFLEALSDLAEVGTMSQRDEPSWQALAELIAAATGYE